MATRKTPARKAASAPVPEEEALAKAETTEASTPEAQATETQVSAEVAEATMPQEKAPETQASAEAATAEGTEVVEKAKEDPEPRFHLFLIDSGWKSTGARVIRENFHMIREFQNHDPLYVLSPEQSIKLIRANPDLVGKDPIIVVHDLHAKGGRGISGYHGFRLCLGVLRDSQLTLRAMQEFLRFLHNHRRSANIEKDIKEKLHRAGLEGAIEILRSGAQDIVGG